MLESPTGGNGRYRDEPLPCVCVARKSDSAAPVSEADGP